jgi:hypothetical protein
MSEKDMGQHAFFQKEMSHSFGQIVNVFVSFYPILFSIAVIFILNAFSSSCPVAEFNDGPKA